MFLSDLAWKKEEDGYVIRAPWKMPPAVNNLNPFHRYKIILTDSREYEGQFITYCYKKAKLDDPHVMVYLELKITQGHVLISEHDVEMFMETGIV